jgi:hypothetical protein
MVQVVACRPLMTLFTPFLFLWAFLRVCIRTLFFYFEESAWGRYFWIPFFVAIPTITLTIAQMNSKLGGWFQDNPLWLVALAASPMAFESLLNFLRAWYNKPVLSERGFFDLVRIIDMDVVGAKLNRFGKKAKEVLARKKGQAKLSSQEIFSEITKPDEQFKAIAMAIHNYFMISIKDPDAPDIQVVIAEADDEKTTSILSFYPLGHSPRSLEKLQLKSSGFSKALRLKKIHIVSDTHEEAHKRFDPGYVLIKGDDDKPWSLICFPVYHPELGTYPMVVSIRALKSGVFEEKHRKTYDYVMKTFARRLCIEYSLLILRREASDVKK